jgi:hypothetical protein
VDSGYVFLLCHNSRCYRVSLSCLSKTDVSRCTRRLRLHAVRTPRQTPLTFARRPRRCGQASVVSRCRASTTSAAKMPSCLTRTMEPKKYYSSGRRAGEYGG